MEKEEEFKNIRNQLSVNRKRFEKGKKAELEKKRSIVSFYKNAKKDQSRTQ